jgi:serine/threonine protein kinase
MASSKQKPAEPSGEGVAAFSPEPKGVADANPSALVRTEEAPLSAPAISVQSLPLPPVSSWCPPDVIGDRFYGVRRLGWGGMGHVYRASDRKLGRDVALKFIREPDALARARFLREAEATAKLQHPNVVTVYDRGEVDGHLYIVMELVSGKSLFDVLKPMAWPRVLELGVALSSGLAAAHAKHILHRDIKPGNVMLTEGGEVKVIDFGLAKIERSSTPSTPPAQECGAAETLRARTFDDAEAIGARTACGKAGLGNRLTDTGTLVGTAGYRAPECWGGEATPRSDVYSCCAVLYELLTNRAVYPDLQPHQQWAAVRDRDAPLVTELMLDVPPKLAEIIARGLSRAQDARYASGKELHEALRELQDQVSSQRDHGGGVQNSQKITTVKSMAWREIGLLMVSVLSAEAPTDEEWFAYLADCQRQAAREPIKVLVLSAGGAPTPPQRQALLELIDEGPVPAAVVADAPTVHSIITVLAWHNSGIRSFSSSAGLDEALKYLEVDGPLADRVRVEIGAMQREVV